MQKNKLVETIDNAFVDSHQNEKLSLALSKDPILAKYWHRQCPIVDESASDWALLGKLLYWLDGDTDAVKKAFMASPYVAQKDAEHQKKLTTREYLNMTVEKILNTNLLTASDTGDQINLLDFDTNDIGNAERLIALYGGDLFTISVSKACYIWDNNCWRLDDGGVLTSKAIDMVKRFISQAELALKNHKYNDKAQALLSFAKKSGNNARIKDMCELAKNMRSVRSGLVDAKHDLLACNNGVINLRNGDLLQVGKNQYITMRSKYDYNPNSTAPTFLKFIRDICGNDQDLMEYLQVALGYSITGETTEQCVFICQGDGCNGKSTLLKIVAEIAGDVSQYITVNSLLNNCKINNQINPELAKTISKRLLIGSETKEEDKLNEAMIKTLTGGEKIYSRMLYHNGVEINPIFKLWSTTNHFPIISKGKSISDVNIPVSVPATEKIKSSLSIKIPLLP